MCIKPQDVLDGMSQRTSKLVYGESFQKYCILPNAAGIVIQVVLSVPFSILPCPPKQYMSAVITVFVIKRPELAIRICSTSVILLPGNLPITEENLPRGG